MAVHPVTDEWWDDDVTPFPGGGERALGRELALLDHEDDLRDNAVRDASGADVEVPPLPSDADLLATLGGPAHPADLLLLESVAVDPYAPRRELLTRLGALRRVSGLVAALESETLVALAGDRSWGDYLAEVHVEHEVAVATRSSRYGAGRAIENARALATDFPGFHDALRAGEISTAHVSALVERTRVVADNLVLREIGRRALPKARRRTPGQFADEVTRLVERLDPDAATRHTRARTKRAVWARPMPDGMGQLGVVHDWSTVAAIKATLDADAAAARALARQQHDEAASGATEDESADDDDATLEALRADALAARVLGTVDADGAVTWDRAAVPVLVEVVIDLATLRGEADRECLLDGQPVPAQAGRELASHARMFRRMDTDPVTAHLLDYGRTQYLPQPLRHYVLARDGGCRAPGCTTRSPGRLQMDHAVEFPEGPTSAANCGGLCLTHHQLKTTGHVDLIDSHTDGSVDWHTTWGQIMHIAPRPYLHDPADEVEPEPPPPAEPDPPPF